MITAAQYFDGKSSALRETTLAFIEDTTELRWQTAEGCKCTWDVKDIQFERYGDLVELRNSRFAGVIIKINNKDFAEQFYTTMKKNKKIDIHTRLLAIGFPKIAAIAFFILTLLVFTYFYALPPLAEKAAALLPESFDTKLGTMAMLTVLDDEKIDKEKTAYLEQFAAQLQLKNTKKLSFSVVKSQDVNAFALPNGHITVYTAILDEMNTAEELAALLGHEVSHINRRHSIKMLCKNMAGYILVSFIFTDINGIMAVLADNAHRLHSLSYSRTFEQEADEQGLQILIDNHVDPNGMLQLFEQLEKAASVSVPKILSTHPLTRDRKAYVQKIISETPYTVEQNDRLTELFQKIKTANTPD